MYVHAYTNTPIHLIFWPVVRWRHRRLYGDTPMHYSFQSLNPSEHIKGGHGRIQSGFIETVRSHKKRIWPDTIRIDRIRQTVQLSDFTEQYTDLLIFLVLLHPDYFRTRPDRIRMTKYGWRPGQLRTNLGIRNLSVIFSRAQDWKSKMATCNFLAKDNVSHTIYILH